MITIYILTYNEEALIEFTIKHYRNRFPNCKLVLLDNQSTDGTKDIAIKYGASIQEFDTNNQIDDFKYLELKNNCWKCAGTDWVLICDSDELLDITEIDLKFEESLGSTIIRSEGYNMVNMNDNMDFESIDCGVRAEQYDKYLVLKRKHLQDINYNPGCHGARPVGNIVYSKKAYKLYHYKFLNPDYQIARYAMYASRLSDNNKKFNMGFHYQDSEELIRIHYKNMRDLARGNRVK